jgi:tetratricopeptide (TPR) repeat protein
VKLRILCLISILFFANCQAKDCDWTTNWKDALEAFSGENYPLACQKYTAAIEQLLADNNLTHPELYISRGTVLQIMQKHNEAIQDFNTALASDFIPLKDTTRAVLYRMVAYASLGMKDESLCDLTLLQSISHDFPIVQNTPDSIIIRNLPHSSLCIKAIKYLFIYMGICSDEDSFKFYDNNTCVIKKKCSCSSKDLSTPINTLNDNREVILNNCEAVCRNSAYSALQLSHLLIAYPAAMSIYTSLIGIVQNTCMWCCAGDGFYVNCIRPFEVDIIDPFIYYVRLFGEKIGKELAQEFNPISTPVPVTPASTRAQ